MKSLRRPLLLTIVFIGLPSMFYYIKYYEKCATLEYASLGNGTTVDVVDDRDPLRHVERHDRPRLQLHRDRHQKRQKSHHLPPGKSLSALKSIPLLSNLVKPKVQTLNASAKNLNLPHNSKAIPPKRKRGDVPINMSSPSPISSPGLANDFRMKIRNGKDKWAVRNLMIEKDYSLKRLGNLQQIVMMNNDTLPSRSFFNTSHPGHICDKSEKTNLCVASAKVQESRFCANLNEHNNRNNAMEKMMKRHKFKIDKSWLLMAIVRDPLDRFISGFVDKCIRSYSILRKPLPTDPNYCNGCKANLTCFLETEYRRMKDHDNIKNFDNTFEDRHFFPQNWRCEFHKYINDYKILRYQSGKNSTLMLLHQLLPLLEHQKVPQSTLKLIETHLASGQTIHSTADSEARRFIERRLRSSPYLMEFVIRMFYHDFKMFNYPLPRISFRKPR